MANSVRVLIVFGWLAATAPATAVAQQQPSTPAPETTEIGKVLEIEGPVGSVLVVRGSQAYALQAGDRLFVGDRVVTRSNGQAKLVANNCEKKLSSSASLVIDKAICETEGTLLADADPSAGIPLLVSAGPGGVGASPGITTGILAAGTSAAAAATAAAEAAPVD